MRIRFEKFLVLD